MKTPYSSEVCLYRSEGFAEDLLDADDTSGMASQSSVRGSGTRSASSIARHSAALLCALPLGAAVMGAAVLGAAVLGAAASDWGWMV